MDSGSWKWLNGQMVKWLNCLIYGQVEAIYSKNGIKNKIIEIIKIFKSWKTRLLKLSKSTNH